MINLGAALACIAMLCLATMDGAAGEADKEKAPTARQLNAATAEALRWLAAQQIVEDETSGHWPVAKYRTAVAALAGLAFLAHGHLPGEGQHGKVIDRAMVYVERSMRKDGYLGGDENSMYVHAICTLFGISYLGMSKDAEKNRKLAEWCRKSIVLIAKAQAVTKFEGEEGGWRYKPQDRSSDVSVTSWQLLALHAARQCGYYVDEEIFTRAMKYVNRAYEDQGPEKGAYYYRKVSSRFPEPGVTGVAIFLKSLLEPKVDGRSERALNYLKDFEPSWGGGGFKGYFYFENFYLAQGMFQLGGDAWKSYSPKLNRILLDHQKGNGSWGFPPDAKPESIQAGKCYATAMALLLLSLDKQYLPMFQRQKKLF